MGGMLCGAASSLTYPAILVLWNVILWSRQFNIPRHFEEHGPFIHKHTLYYQLHSITYETRIPNINTAET
jgi:hypothetical protein